MDCLVSTFGTQNNTIVILIYVDYIYFKNLQELLNQMQGI